MASEKPIVSNGGWRVRLSARANTRAAASAEILLVLALTFGHRVLHVIPVDETLPIFLLGWLSLWLRGQGWRGVGLARPASWPRTIAVGVAVGVSLQALSEYVTEPLITTLTGHVADLSAFQRLVGNWRLALLYLGIVWTWAAFGEEMTYRGFVLNRAADVLDRTKLGWLLGLLFVTGLFGVGHSYQGLAGVLDTGIHGLIFGAVYLASRRNLWACVIAHGVCDTVGIAMIFFGWL